MARKSKWAWRRQRQEPLWTYYKHLCHTKARRAIRIHLKEVQHGAELPDKVDLKAPLDAYEDWWGWD